MTTGRESRGPGRPPADSTVVPTPDRILEVASQLFMELGFEGVSMEKVAEVAGITKAVVYYYYASKANLFTAAMVRMMEGIRQRTENILQRDESLYNRLLTIMQIRLRIDAPLDFASIMRGGNNMLTDEQTATLHEAEQRLFDSVAEAFRRASDDGSIRRIDAVLAARVYMAILMIGKDELSATDATRMLSEQPFDTDERARQLLDFMWQGIEGVR